MARQGREAAHAGRHEDHAADVEGLVFAIACEILARDGGGWEHPEDGGQELDAGPARGDELNGLEVDREEVERPERHQRVYKGEEEGDARDSGSGLERFREASDRGPGGNGTHRLPNMRGGIVGFLQNLDASYQWNTPMATIPMMRGERKRPVGPLVIHARVSKGV